MTARSVLLPDAESDLVLHSWQTLQVTHVPHGTHPVHIIIKRARYAQPGRTTRIKRKDIASASERLLRAPMPDLAEGRHITTALLDYIRITGVTRSIREIADQVGLSVGLIREIVQPIRRQFIERYRPAAPKYLVIDEVHIRSSKNTVFSDAVTGAPFEMTQNARQETVEQALRSFEGIESVVAVSCDLFASYLAALRTVLPNVPVVIDRWHVQKLARQAFDEVRTGIFSQALPSDRNESRNVRTYSYVLDKNRSDMTAFEKVCCENVLSQHPLLRAAYGLKNDFFVIYKFSSKWDAINYFHLWARNIPAGLAETFGRLRNTVQRHSTEIFAYWDVEILRADGTIGTLTTSTAENANKKINALIRQGAVQFERLRQMALLRYGPLSPAEVVRLATADYQPVTPHRPAQTLPEPQTVMTAETGPASRQTTLFDESHLLGGLLRGGTARRRRLPEPKSSQRSSAQYSLLAIMGEECNGAS